MCCNSLRGVAFFGASVHIAVGFILFSRYVIATVVFTFYNFNNLFSEKVTAFLAPFMVYVTLLLALGIIIFHSVEKECFVLLKWSSVAFSLLQLIVFVAILVLKLTPYFQYHQFPFFPESFIASVSNIQSSNSPPAGPEVWLTVPHGTTLDEKDLLIKPSSKSPSSDPPDPGGTPGGFELTIPSSNTNNSSKDNDGLLLTEIYRLTILICCVLLTLVYLLFLFLYIRQLNYEDTGHVFGHTVTRHIAFYVQPQYSSPNPLLPPQQGTQDNNKGQPVQVQRSQTQIPQQFLPQHAQQSQPQPQQSPKKMMNQVQAHSHPPSSVDGSGSNPEVQRSPKRQVRSSSQQSSLQSQLLQNTSGLNYSPKRMNPHLQTQPQPPPQPNVGGGVVGDTCDTNLNPTRAPRQHLLPQTPSQLQLPILGPTPGSGIVAQALPNHQHHGRPQPQIQPQLPTMRGRGPIPAQVRIGFYPHDLRQDPQSQNLGVSPQDIRPRTASFVNERETEMMVQQQEQGQLNQTLLRGPPPLPMQYHNPHPQPRPHPHHPPQTFPQQTQPPPLGHHSQMQRVQFQQHSAYPSDSSSSVAYSPNPPRDSRRRNE